MLVGEAQRSEAAVRAVTEPNRVFVIGSIAGGLVPVLAVCSAPRP